MLCQLSRASPQYSGRLSVPFLESQAAPPTHPVLGAELHMYKEGPRQGLLWGLCEGLLHILSFHPDIPLRAFGDLPKKWMLKRGFPGLCFNRLFIPKNRYCISTKNKNEILVGSLGRCKNVVAFYLKYYLESLVP